jgi:transcriptional regulator with GAF, ATPase, and Fis domain
VDFTEAERAHAAGELERAAELYRAGLASAEPLAAAAARSQLGGVLQELGRLDEAVSELEGAVAVLEGSDLARACNRLGVVHRLRGDLSAAGDCHERARAAAAEVSDLAQQGVAVRNLVEVAASRGDVEGASALAGEAARVLAGANDLRGLGATWRRFSELALETGRLEDALRACEAEVECRAGRARSRPLAKAARLAQLLGREESAQAHWSALEEHDPRAAGLGLAELALAGGRPGTAVATLARLGLEENELLARCDLAVLDAYVHESDPLRALREEVAASDDPVLGEVGRLAQRAHKRAALAAREAQGGDALARASTTCTLARAGAHMGRGEAASANARAALELLPREPGALDLLRTLRVAREAGALVGEVEVLEGLAKRSPAAQVTLALAVAGRVRFEAGEVEAGRSLWEQALEMGPSAALRADLEALLRMRPAPVREAGALDELLSASEAAARSRLDEISPDALRDAAFDLLRLQEITRELNSERDQDGLLALILDTAVGLTSAERGFVVLVGEGERVACRASRDLDRREVEAPDRRVSNTVARLAIESGEPVVSGDASQDDRFGSAESVAGERLLSVVCVPLRQRGQTVGAVYLDHRAKRGLFDRRAVALLQSLADQAAVALLNAQREQDVRERAEALEGEQVRLRDEVQAKEDQVADLRQRLDEAGRRTRHREILGESPAMQRVFDLIDQVSKSDVPVLVHGESGTGKELVARAIHYSSARAAAPLVSESLAAISDDMVESELFGHLAGAFTGASEDRPGLFRAANGGTLFLDEVGDMSARCQAVLLRVLETSEVRPLGSERAEPVDFRLVAATHRDLAAMVRDGEFRLDVFYRLQVIAIELPPLRERVEDIPLLVEHFLSATLCEPRTFTPEAMRKLQSFAWPGNVRQLRNFVERVAILSEGPTIGPEELSFGTASETHDAIEVLDLAPWSEAKEAFARRYLKAILERVEGNVTQGATQAGMRRQAFQRLIKRHDLDAGNWRS